MPAQGGIAPDRSSDDLARRSSDRIRAGGRDHGTVVDGAGSVGGPGPLVAGGAVVVTVVGGVVGAVVGAVVVVVGVGVGVGVGTELSPRPARGGKSRTFCPFRAPSMNAVQISTGMPPLEIRCPFLTVTGSWPVFL